MAGSDVDYLTASAGPIIVKVRRYDSDPKAKCGPLHQPTRGPPIFSACSLSAHRWTHRTHLLNHDWACAGRLCSLGQL